MHVCTICTIQCDVQCMYNTYNNYVRYIFVSCAGDVVAVRTFGDQVVTEHNTVPPNDSRPSQHPQTLTADLDRFSLECASCEDAIPAVFEYADSSARMYAVLSDHALSVFITPVILTDGQVTLTQVHVHVQWRI